MRFATAAVAALVAAGAVADAIAQHGAFHLDIGPRAPGERHVSEQSSSRRADPAANQNTHLTVLDFQGPAMTWHSVWLDTNDVATKPETVQRQARAFINNLTDGVSSLMALDSRNGNHPLIQKRTPRKRCSGCFVGGGISERGRQAVRDHRSPSVAGWPGKPELSVQRPHIDLDRASVFGDPPSVSRDRVHPPPATKEVFTPPQIHTMSGHGRSKMEKMTLLSKRCGCCGEGAPVDHDRMATTRDQIRSHYPGNRQGLQPQPPAPGKAFLEPPQIHTISRHSDGPESDKERLKMDKRTLQKRCGLCGCKESAPVDDDRRGRVAETFRASRPQRLRPQPPAPAEMFLTPPPIESISSRLTESPVHNEPRIEIDKRTLPGTARERPGR